MRIFFAVSPRALPKCKSEYNKIYKTIEKFGHQHVNDIAVAVDPTTFYNQTPSQVKSMYMDLMKRLKNADIIIIDVTIHSLTMGFYTKMSLDLEKPTILLHQPGNPPYFFQGIQNDRLQIVEYTLENIEEVLSAAIEYASESLDTRFNLMIDTELNEYLKWAAQKMRTPRSTFVRNLILEHKRVHLTEYLDDMKK